MTEQKPKILITMHYMELGGAESALLGLLQSHDPARADLDLFIFAHRGELMEFIPKDKVNLLPEVPIYSLLESPITEVVKRGYFRLALARLRGRRESDKFSVANVKHLDNFAALTYQQAHTVKLLPAINPSVEYDLAISFNTPHYIVLDKVRAKKKLGWIHMDFTNSFFNLEMEGKMWGRLDYIGSISEEVGNKFSEVFPALKDKVYPIENILSSAFIRQRSTLFVPEDMPREEGVINLLSIGRYSYPKRFDKVGTLCKQIIASLGGDYPKQVKWYIIGYGSEAEYQKIVDNVRAEGMEQHVVLLGKRSNPYPYIKACDIYLQPSRYEGKSVTVREAQILHKPVAVSHYATAPSQIQDGTDGVIVPMEETPCAEGIARLIQDADLQQRIVAYLQTHNYGNESEIEKIYSLVEHNTSRS